jgi:glycosyltransferase involved in cell wall biosynthesis
VADGRARPLRVCVMTSVHPPLDTRIFHREAKAARSFGHEVLLIAPGAPPGPVDGVRFESLPAWGGRPGRLFRWPVLFVKAWRAKADVYHFHDPELLPWGLLLQWTRRRPVVYDSHEYLRESILGKHWIPAPLRRPIATIADRIEKFAARRLAAVVAVTDEMAGRFRRVQPNTVTLRNLPPAPGLPDPLPPRDPAVIYSGLMNLERGLSILYDTARLVRERHPECEFRILGAVEWWGVPPSARRSEGEWATAGVRFLGTVPQPEVAAHLARASVGWLPRDPTVENNLLAWPNKLVEYMIVGLPVVASDLPLQAAVVREAQCGLVVEAMSPSAHAEAICQLLDNPARARQLGANGKAAAESRYTWESESLKLQRLYTALAGA